MNYKPTKWLGTHCVSGSCAAVLLRYAWMSEAWEALDEYQRYEVLKANNRRNMCGVDYGINPFTKLRSDPRVVPCSFKLSDGASVTGRYWVNGAVVLVTDRGHFTRGHYVRVH